MAGLSLLFLGWRRLLTRAVRASTRQMRRCAAKASRWAAQWRRVRAYHTGSDTAWTPEGRDARATAAAFGLRALAGGLAFATALATAGGEPLVGGGLVVLVELLWASARFAIVALLVPTAEIGREDLFIAYAAALVPFALGLTPTLRLAALAASALLTLRGLHNAGVSQAVARRAVGWAFGGHAAVLALGLVARGVLALSVGL